MDLLFPLSSPLRLCISKKKESAILAILIDSSYLVFQIAVRPSRLVRAMWVTQNDPLPALIQYILQEGFQMWQIFTSFIWCHRNILVSLRTHFLFIKWMTLSEWEINIKKKVGYTYGEQHIVRHRKSALLECRTLHIWNFSNWSEIYPVYWLSWRPLGTFPVQTFGCK